MAGAAAPVGGAATVPCAADIFNNEDGDKARLTVSARFALGLRPVISSWPKSELRGRAWTPTKPSIELPSSVMFYAAMAMRASVKEKCGR